MKKHSLVISLVVLALILSVAGAIMFKIYIKEPLPSGGTYKEVTSYSDGAFIYECSRPIRAKLAKIPAQVGGYVDGYIPIDMAEAKLFCHSTAVIEYEGKLKVLQKPEVLEMISKYEYKDVTIKALEFEYIQDKNFVHRLLPDYRDKEIGCIIVLQTPDGGMVYLENEELETFEELDYQTFMGYLNKVSPADKQLFLDNLQ